MARLDRFLITDDWENYVGNVTQSTLLRPLSDHFRISLIGGGSLVHGPTPFRFENMWLKTKGFESFIDGWWKSFDVRGGSSFVVAEKLKVLKIKLKGWNKEVFGRVEMRKNQALKNMTRWDTVGAIRPLTRSKLDRKIVELEEFKRWALLEEIMLRQKSRGNWLKEGDRNTKFFHKMANSHKKHSEMTGLKIDGVWHNEGQDMQQGIVNALQSLLVDLGDWRANVEGLTFSKLEVQEASRLEKPLTEEEVFFAPHELNEEKAPGPDGHTVAFWQFSWEMVKGEVMVVFKDFFVSDKFVKSLNSTFIVMVPKKEGVDDFKDFRPISLVGSLYKLIANMLKKVMSRLVNKAPNAFVEGRQILDASLIENEAIDSVTRRKEKGILCKLDVEKAYDKLNWKFLLRALR